MVVTDWTDPLTLRIPTEIFAHFTISSYADYEYAKIKKITSQNFELVAFEIYTMLYHVDNWMSIVK